LRDLFRSYDYVRDRPFTLWERIKWTLTWPYWHDLGKLSRWGFIDGELGTYIRLRNFTPFFWRTLLKRQKASLEARFAYELSVKQREAADEREREVFAFLKEHIGSPEWSGRE
jgi:hypothetical protein